MRWPLREEELPRGYRLTRSRAGVLVFDEAAGPALVSAGFGPGGSEELVPSEFRGRRPLPLLRAAGGSEGAEIRYLVRPFHHGGLFRWLGPYLYLNPTRPFRELELALELEALGIRTPRVIAARARRFGMLDLVTRVVEGCVDGAGALERLRRGELSFGQRRTLFHGAGRLVGRLHRHGFLHGDLHPRNLLFNSRLEDPSAVWVIDLDGSRFVRGGLDEGLRQDNLARAWRWIRRKEERLGRVTSRTDLARFLRAYRRELGGGEAWAGDWRGVERRDRRGKLLHRAGWWLEGRLGVGHERHGG